MCALAFGQVLGSQDYEFLQSLEADKQKTREKKAEEEAEVSRLFKKWLMMT